MLKASLAIASAIAAATGLTACAAPAHHTAGKAAASVTTATAAAAVSAARTDSGQKAATETVTIKTSGGRWRVVRLPSIGFGSAASPVAAAGGTRWALETDRDDRIALWRNTGTGWSRASFPVTRFGGYPLDIRADSATDAWALVNGSRFATRVLHWNGLAWSDAGRLPTLADDLVVFGRSDAWAFGAAARKPGGYAWHWDGRTWSPVHYLAAGRSYCGSGLAPDSLWVGAGTSIVHWNGSSWSSTSLAGVLAPWQANDPWIGQIVAESPHSVYAITYGEGASDQGPIVLLHWNGRIWSALGLAGGGQAASLASDGHGGAWVDVDTDGPEDTLLHWTGGRFVTTALPWPKGTVGLGAIARTSATGNLLIGGDFLATAYNVFGDGTPVLFEYTP